MIMPYRIGAAEKRRKILQEELERILPKIISLDVEKVFLFGSLATGTVSRASDIDLIIIKKTEKGFLERPDEIYKRLKPNVGIDILVYTPEEFEEMSRNNQFVKSALKNGRVLYEG